MIGQEFMACLSKNGRASLRVRCRVESISRSGASASVVFLEGPRMGKGGRVAIENLIPVAVYADKSAPVTDFFRRGTVIR